MIVRDEHFTIDIQNDFIGRAEGGGGPVSARSSSSPGYSCIGGDNALRSDFPDRVVGVVRNECISRRVHDNPGRSLKLGRSPYAVQRSGGDSRCAREGGDRAAGHDNLANRIIRRIHNQKVAGGVKGKALRSVKFCAQERTVGSPRSSWGPSIGRNHAAWGNLSNRVIARIRDKEVSRRVQGKIVRILEACSSACGVGTPRRDGRVSPCKSAYRAGGCNFTDGMVVEISDKQITGRIEGHPKRIIKSICAQSPVHECS